MTDHDALCAVWNRACDSAGTGVGDRHLSALLLIHGMVQNGGPNHVAAFETGYLAAPADFDPVGRGTGTPRFASDQ